MYVWTMNRYDIEPYLKSWLNPKKNVMFSLLLLFANEKIVGTL